MSNIATVSVDVTPVNDRAGRVRRHAGCDRGHARDGCSPAGDVDSLRRPVRRGLTASPWHGDHSKPRRNLGGSFTYTPAANYNGPDSFTFRAVDAGLNSNVATVTITVAPVNDAPVATSVVVTTQEGVAQSGVLRRSDVDGDALTFSIVTPPTKGTLTITDATTGAFTYTPNAGAVGYDTFTFRAADGAGASSTAHGHGVHRRGLAALAGPDRARQRREQRRAGQRQQPRAGAQRGRALRRVPLDRVEPGAGDTNGTMDVFVRDRQTGADDARERGERRRAGQQRQLTCRAQRGRAVRRVPLVGVEPGGRRHERHV